ncbi:hypothetical protein A6J89_000145 [Pasteurella multocida]|nr:hypothetical protein A6J89_000145 [Pasteurella multocida]
MIICYLMYYKRGLMYTGRREFERNLDYIIEELGKKRQKLDIFNDLVESRKISFGYKNFLRLTNSSRYPELEAYKKKNKARSD